MISSLRQKIAGFSIAGVLADANGFGKPDNNIAAADAPSNELHHESTTPPDSSTP